MFNKKFKEKKKSDKDREILDELDLTWKDTIALIIAFFQILLPYLFLFLAVWVGLALLFRMWLIR